MKRTETIELTEQAKKIILKTIADLAKQGNYRLTYHANDERAIERNMTQEDVKNILLFPNRIIRAEKNHKYKDVVFKIEGGLKRQKLAVCVQGNIILVITVMDE